MAIISHLEYRFNLFTDAVLQPALTAGIEFALWIGIFRGAGTSSIAGFPRESYLAYAAWAPFFARISANWMYEYRMLDEIQSGSVNAILSRPLSFYEFYLSQFMGYKALTSALSLAVIVAVFAVVDSSTILQRLPLSLLLVIFYLILAHTISFTVACLGFYFNNVGGLTMGKNITLWMLSGELFPLDMAPEPFRGWLMALPFSAGVYRPVGFLVGRIGYAEMGSGFVSVAIGLAAFGAVARMAWMGGRRRYAGTGA
jgi:ABC-2 type transport system permease protein